jgi:transposase
MRKRIEGDLEDGDSVAQVADRRVSIRTVQRYLNRIEQQGNADARAAGGG